MPRCGKVHFEARKPLRKSRFTSSGRNYALLDESDRCPLPPCANDNSHKRTELATQFTHCNGCLRHLLPNPAVKAVEDGKPRDCLVNSRICCCSCCARWTCSTEQLLKSFTCVYLVGCLGLTHYSESNKDLQCMIGSLFNIVEIPRT